MNLTYISAASVIINIGQYNFSCLPNLFLFWVVCTLKKITASLKDNFMNFPGGLVVKNLPVNAGYMGLIPGSGRSHMLWSN